MDLKLLLSLCIFALLLGCTATAPASNPENQTGGNNNTLAPRHTPNEIVTHIQKYLVVYYGLWNVDIPSPEYSAGEWRSDVKLLTDEGGFSVLRVSFSDENLSVGEMWQRVFPNKEPLGIAPIVGKMSCSEGKVKVMEFANPYCPNCVAFEKAGNALRQRFNGSIDYEYGVMLPKTNAMIEAYGYENVSLTSNYYACAQEQGLLDGFRKCVMEKYSLQTGKPLSENRLESCAIDNGLNVTEVKSCVADANKLIDFDMKLGQTYLGTYADLPSFVVDCRFKTTNPNLVRYAICYEFPETEGC